MVETNIIEFEQKYCFEWKPNVIERISLKPIGDIYIYADMWSYSLVLYRNGQNVCATCQTTRGDIVLLE